MTALPSTHPPVTPPRQQAPGVLQALGVILLYFLLQVAAGVLMGLAVGALEKVRHPELSLADARKHAMAVLQQPDSNAMLVVIALPLIALLLFWLVHRMWPPLWARGDQPGFGFTAPTAFRWYGTALLVGVVMPPLGALITQLLAHGHEVTQNVQELSQHASPSLRLPLSIVAVTVGPMIEELMFRGVLLSALLRRLSVTTSIICCAVLFACVHLDGLQFQWYALPNLTLLAAALCWLRLKSGSLWPAILAHGLYNLFALVALFAAA
ncbi:CPBP family intramembrane metalloprotease [Dyella monticola]|uniref:CPBP family intramembrane metalloprotease n=1 Tax=Dyella monticola TaxID=1927958 RepID=A0A370X8Q9_9GAMM|nr:CPBP family intramembrane glutamic endopeptidase [Dyella monticola]RDS84778.1 CPBP family intramembrane metalloprotease [Dyella monticola]